MHNRGAFSSFSDNSEASEEAEGAIWVLVFIGSCISCSIAPAQGFHKREPAVFTGAPRAMLSNFKLRASVELDVFEGIGGLPTLRTTWNRPLKP